MKPYCIIGQPQIMLGPPLTLYWRGDIDIEGHHGRWVRPPGETDHIWQVENGGHYNAHPDPLHVWPGSPHKDAAAAIVAAAACPGQSCPVCTAVADPAHDLCADFRFVADAHHFGAAPGAPNIHVLLGALLAIHHSALAVREEMMAVFKAQRENGPHHHGSGHVMLPMPPQIDLGRRAPPEP